VATTVSVRYVLRLLEVAEHRGVPREALCGETGIEVPVADEPDLRVRADVYYRLFGAAMARLRDPALPLRVAKRMDFASFDALGFGVAVSRTFGEALERIQRYLRFMTDAIRWDVRVQRSEIAITLVQLAPTGAEARFVDEVSLAHMVLTARTLTGVDVRPVSVRFRHAEPEDTRAQREFFGAPLEYACTDSELRFANGVLDLPLLRADAKMAAFFVAYLEKALEKAYPESSTAAAVREVLPRALAENAWSFDEIATRLGTTPPRLRKRLRDEGLAYQAILEGVRRSLAEYHLRERRLSLGEIAYALGYSEPAAFHRAFRRWTAMTPAAFRASHFPK
jgi:AraC-like DNA-binding protein